MGRPLTVGECLLLRQILAGDDLAEIADGLGVSQGEAFQEIGMLLRKVSADVSEREPGTRTSSATTPADEVNGQTRTAAHERRREARTRVAESCRVVSFNGSIFIKATLVDLSASGARLRLRPSPQVEQPILIQRADGQVQSGTIIWVEHDFAGVRFKDEERRHKPSRRNHSIDRILQED